MAFFNSWNTNVSDWRLSIISRSSTFSLPTLMVVSPNVRVMPPPPSFASFSSCASPSIWAFSSPPMALLLRSLSDSDSYCCFSCASRAAFDLMLPSSF